MRRWLAVGVVLAAVGCNYRPPSPARPESSWPEPGPEDIHVDFGADGEFTARLDLETAWAMRTQSRGRYYRWMNGIEADLVLELPEPRDVRLFIRASPLWSDWRQQTLAVYVNNRHVADWVMADHADPMVYEARLPARRLVEGDNRFTLRAGYVAPAPGPDPRHLSVCMFDLLLRPEDGP